MTATRILTISLALATMAGCGGGTSSFEYTGSVAEPEEANTRGSFGWAVDTDGETLVAGARNDRDQDGGAYVFAREADDGWTQAGSLTGSEDQSRSRFGAAVAVDGDVIMVGSPEEDLVQQDEGAVYVFSRGSDGTWNTAGRLTASTPDLNGDFGRHVALVGDRALIASPFFGGTDMPGGFRGGAVYVFERSDDGSWAETGILQPDELRPDLRYGLRFGFALDFDGTRALIGADPIRGGDDNPPGLAYVFDLDGDGQWSQQAVLTAPGASGENKFGTAVALAGDVAVVGAPGENSYAGGAHIFERQVSGEWAHTAHLVAPDSVTRGNYGYDVAAGDSTVVIFAMASGTEATAGDAYVYDRRADGWTLVQRISPTAMPEIARFDRGVLLRGDRLLATGRDAERDKRIFFFER